MLALLAFLALRVPLAAADIEDLKVRPARDGLDVAFRLEDAFTPEIEDRLRGGVEVSFELVVRLRKQRGTLPDKTTSERLVVASAKYSTLTRMYRLTRQIDGTVIEQDITDERGVMESWLTRFELVRLFDERDVDGKGVYYVRVKARLLDRVKALVIPWDLETPWSESERLPLPERRP